MCPCFILLRNYFDFAGYFRWLSSACFALQCLFSVCLALHCCLCVDSLRCIDSTPLGRIMNRFAKGKTLPTILELLQSDVPVDIDTIDNLLGDAFRMLASTSSGILGAIILISIVLPWFLIAVAVVLSVVRTPLYLISCNLTTFSVFLRCLFLPSER